MKIDNLLPLGSVVYLEEGQVPIMIVLRHPILKIEDESYYFDYAGVNHIIGLEPEKITYFNQNNIDRIVFEGYKSEYESQIKRGLAEWVEAHPEVSKGEVDEINKLLKK